MNTQLTDAWALSDSGDPQGAMRALRSAADTLAPAEIAPLVGRLAEGAGFADLAQASAALHAGPEQARGLYEFGYACVGRGIPALAVPALRRALRLALAGDGRTAEELAEVIATAAGAPDEGDGQTPADGDEVLAGFAARVRETWLTGARDRVRSSGPVRSARFA